MKKEFIFSDKALKQLFIDGATLKNIEALKLLKDLTINRECGSYQIYPKEKCKVWMDKSTIDYIEYNKSIVIFIAIPKLEIDIALCFFNDYELICFLDDLLANDILMPHMPYTDEQLSCMKTFLEFKVDNFFELSKKKQEKQKADISSLPRNYNKKMFAVMHYAYTLRNELNKIDIKKSKDL